MVIIVSYLIISLKPKYILWLLLESRGARGARLETRGANVFELIIKKNNRCRSVVTMVKIPVTM
jgi:hypothetical protein